MSFIKIKQKGETSDKFQELIISNAPQLKDVPVGNIAVSGPSGEIVDSGVNAAQLQENVNTLQENTNALAAEVEETKKSVASGKELLAASISGKKIPTNANDSFATMASNIDSISTSGPYVWEKCEILDSGKGIFIEFVTSEDSTEHPEDGEQDGYWYQRYYDHGINVWKKYEKTADNTKGNFIDYIVAKDSNEYPENGVFLDNYYEKLLSKEIVDSSAALANQIFNGKVAIVNGGKVTGTALATTTTATAANIMSGLTAYDNNGNLITGTKHFKTGTVTATSTTSLSISGLGFTPKYIILTAEGAINNSQDSYRRVHFLNNSSGTVWGGYSGYSSYSYGYYSTYMGSGIFTITFGNGTVSLSNNSSYYFAATTYRYTVWD